MGFDYHSKGKALLHKQQYGNFSTAKFDHKHWNAHRWNFVSRGYINRQGHYVDEVTGEIINPENGQVIEERILAPLRPVDVLDSHELNPYDNKQRRALHAYQKLTSTLEIIKPDPATRTKIYRIFRQVLKSGLYMSLGLIRTIVYVGYGAKIPKWRYVANFKSMRNITLNAHLKTLNKLFGIKDTNYGRNYCHKKFRHLTPEQRKEVDDIRIHKYDNDPKYQEMKKLKSKRQRVWNPEKWKAYYKKYYTDHRDEMKEYQRKRRIANKDELNRKQRERYKKKKLLNT